MRPIGRPVGRILPLGRRFPRQLSLNCHLRPSQSTAHTMDEDARMTGSTRLLLAAAALTFGFGVHAADITGAGATFPYPVYAKWADAYKTKTGIGMNYQSIGSGGGIAQIKAK